MIYLRAENLGFEAFNVTAADMLSVVPTEELIRRYCPSLKIWHRIEGTERTWSVEKAGESSAPSLLLLTRRDRRELEGARVNRNAVLTAVSSGFHKDIRGRFGYARSGRQ